MTPKQEYTTNNQQEFIDNLSKLINSKLVRVFVDGSSNPLFNIEGVMQFSNHISFNTFKTKDVVITMTTIILTESIAVDYLNITYIILSKYEGFKTTLCPLLKKAYSRNAICVESYEELVAELNKL